MSQIKEWQYERLVSQCREYQEHYVYTVLYQNNKSIRQSAWLRLMGLMETWDMSDV